MPLDDVAGNECRMTGADLARHAMLVLQIVERLGVGRANRQASGFQVLDPLAAAIACRALVDLDDGRWPLRSDGGEESGEHNDQASEKTCHNPSQNQPTTFVEFYPNRRCTGCRTSRSEIRIQLHRDPGHPAARSEEHTSELQSQSNLVCRLLLEKKKKKNKKTTN